MSADKKELDQFLLDEGYLEDADCSEEEQKRYLHMQENNDPLPDDVYLNDDKKFVRRGKSGLTGREFAMLLMMKQNRLLRYIHSELIAVILLILGLLLFMMTH
jgi:hypothetical protein